MRRMMRIAAGICAPALLLAGCRNKDEDADFPKGDSSFIDTVSVSMMSAEEYYNTYSEKVIEVVSAEDYGSLFTEAEAAELFADRGFTGYPVTYDYSVSGKKLDVTEVDTNSDEKHPIYQTYYVTENNDVWAIYLIGDALSADALSYAYEENSSTMFMVSESDEFLSYDGDENKFYRTVPKESAVILRTVDEVNADVLSGFAKEEFE